jgi:hypothetical protein
MKKEGVECSKCWYWHKEIQKPFGECKVNPPIHIPASGDDPKKGLWLRTNGTDWCGKFKAENK